MLDDFNEIMSHLSENSRFALQKADMFSKRYNNGYMGTEHILLGLLAQDTSTGAGFIRSEGINLGDVEKSLGKVATEVKGDQMAMMSLSEAAVLTLRMAANFTRENGLDLIGTEHILYSLIRQPSSRASGLLTKLKVDLQQVATHIEDYVEKQAEELKLEKKKQKAGKSQPLRWLSRYATDLTEQATEGKLDTVIGRDAEIERTITILCRRTKSNPVLIGEAGVGKTAIIEGLAQRIAKNNVPGLLIGKRIYQVDLSSVVAGTKFRGEFEERIKGVIDEAIDAPDVILFIDELHLLNGAGSAEGSMDAANILKPALARGQIHLIGATTLDEYRKNIEKDKALSRRFQTVIVDEPSPTITLRILKGIKKHYEAHHQVTISDEILEQSVYMAERYISDRYAPDKVIDIIDEAAALARVGSDSKGATEYKKIMIEIKDIEANVDKAVEKEDYEKAAHLKQRMALAKKRIEQLKKSWNPKTDVPPITMDHLARAISLKTGIPTSKVHGDEQKLLIKLESHLKKSIIGQDEAIATVAKAIRRGRSGIGSAARPIGSFVFMGPTGVGKTELARVIAREVFGGKDSLIKIDMSEFGEKHNVSRLVGAPAGYIGYDDGGKLTEQIRRRPYSVVLFDEIEKAHPDVWGVLLQILEDGTLTDGQGQKVKFNNSIVILTSNLGAAEMHREAELGFSAKTKSARKDLAAEHEENKTYCMKALKKLMKPEMINRLDAILTFHALSRAEVSKIFDNLLEDLKRRLAEKSIGLKITPQVKNHLIKLGYDAKNGARPLRRALEDHLETLLAEAILNEKLQKGAIASVILVKNQLKLAEDAKE